MFDKVWQIGWGKILTVREWEPHRSAPNLVEVKFYRQWNSAYSAILHKSSFDIEDKNCLCGDDDCGL